MKFTIAIVALIATVSAVSIRGAPEGEAPKVPTPLAEHERPGYPNIDSDGGFVIKQGSM